MSLITTVDSRIDYQHPPAKNNFRFLQSKGDYGLISNTVPSSLMPPS